MVEVDGLPDVQGDRPGGGRVPGPAPEHVVESSADPVQTRAGGREVHPRGLVGLARRQPDLTRVQQFAAAEDRRPVGQPLRVLDVVAAPGGMHAPDLAVPEAEVLGTGEQQPGVEAGPATPALPRPHALPQRSALRGALPGPAAREVQQFRGLGGHRQHARQPVQGVGVRGRVGQGVAQPHHALLRHLQLGVQREPRAGVQGPHADGAAPAVLGAHGDRFGELEAQGADPAVAVPGQGRTSEPAPALPLGGHQTPGLVARGPAHGIEHLRGVAGAEAGIDAPVQHPGHLGSGGVEREGRVTGRQHDEVRLSHFVLVQGMVLVQCPAGATPNPRQHDCHGRRGRRGHRSGHRAVPGAEASSSARGTAGAVRPTDPFGSVSAHKMPLPTRSPVRAPFVGGLVSAPPPTECTPRDNTFALALNIPWPGMDAGVAIAGQDLQSCSTGTTCRRI